MSNVLGVNFRYCPPSPAASISIGDEVMFREGGSVLDLAWMRLCQLEILAMTIVYTVLVNKQSNMQLAQDIFTLGILGDPVGNLEIGVDG